MKGRIVIGYPGCIGWVFGKDRCMYLYTDTFTIDGRLPDKWYEAYCETALCLANQGYQVYINYTEDIFNYFADLLGKYGKPWNIDEILLLGPSKELREHFNNILNIWEAKEKTNDKSRKDRNLGI